MPFMSSFPRLFEMTAVIPIVKDLKIAVVDSDIIGRDDVIGETTIDLEQRVLSRFHATVGCAKFYSKWVKTFLLFRFFSALQSARP